MNIFWPTTFHSPVHFPSPRPPLPPPAYIHRPVYNPLPTPPIPFDERSVRRFSPHSSSSTPSASSGSDSDEDERGSPLTPPPIWLDPASASDPGRKSWRCQCRSSGCDCPAPSHSHHVHCHHGEPNHHPPHPPRHNHGGPPPPPVAPTFATIPEFSPRPFVPPNTYVPPSVPNIPRRPFHPPEQPRMPDLPPLPRIPRRAFHPPPQPGMPDLPSFPSIPRPPFAPPPQPEMAEIRPMGPSIPRRPFVPPRNPLFPDVASQPPVPHPRRPSTPFRPSAPPHPSMPSPTPQVGPSQPYNASASASQNPPSAPPHPWPMPEPAFPAHGPPASSYAPTTNTQPPAPKASTRPSSQTRGNPISVPADPSPSFSHGSARPPRDPASGHIRHPAPMYPPAAHRPPQRSRHDGPPSRTATNANSTARAESGGSTESLLSSVAATSAGSTDGDGDGDGDFPLEETDGEVHFDAPWGPNGWLAPGYPACFTIVCGALPGRDDGRGEGPAPVHFPSVQHYVAFRMACAANRRDVPAPRAILQMDARRAGRTAGRLKADVPKGRVASWMREGTMAKFAVGDVGSGEEEDGGGGVMTGLLRRLLETHARGLKLVYDSKSPRWGTGRDGRGRNEYGRCLEDVRMEVVRMLARGGGGAQGAR